VFREEISARVACPWRRPSEERSTLARDSAAAPLHEEGQIKKPTTRRVLRERERTSVLERESSRGRLSKPQPKTEIARKHDRTAAARTSRDRTQKPGGSCPDMENRTGESRMRCHTARGKRRKSGSAEEKSLPRHRALRETQTFGRCAAVKGCRRKKTNQNTAARNPAWTEKRPRQRQ
jgi:hypothetical protein